MHSDGAATLLVSLFWVSQVLAIVPRSPFRDSFILPRQTVCDSECAVFTDALNGCTTLGCLCTSVVARGLQSCVDCTVTTSPTADVIGSAQDLVGIYTGQCAGFGLPPVTVISGSGGNSGPSTSSPIRTSGTPTPPSVTTTRTNPAVSSTISTPLITTPTFSSPTTNLPLTSIDDTFPSIFQSTVHPFTSTGITGGPGQGIPGLLSGAITTHGLTCLGAFLFSTLFGVLLAL